MSDTWKTILVLVLILGSVIALGVAAMGDSGDSTSQEPLEFSETASDQSFVKPEPIFVDDLDLTTTDSGLQYQTTQEGEGEDFVLPGDTVKIHYLGNLEDGTVFDNSYDGGQPFETQIGVGIVIAGWDEGVLGMKVGEKKTLVIPAELGYGEGGTGNIPGGATLIFQVELVDISRTA